MPLMNKSDYLASLGGVHPIVYHMGKRIKNLLEYQNIRPHINSAALTYEFATQPQYEELLTATSHLTGGKINRFTHIHQNTGDLVKKVKALRLLGQQTGACFQRCVGWDALNTTFSVTYEIDRKYGTKYHDRFLDFLLYVQENDLMVAGAMTDPKGNRSLKPSQQKDPDLFLHVTEKNDKGIFVNGAKAHMTGMVNSHVMLVMPTESMSEEDRDYAVVFAVPIDAQGVTHIFGRQTNDNRRWEEYSEIDTGNFKYGMVGGEALTVFDHVFVPWERVFMCGEYDFSSSFVERFATLHRQNYGGCKTGVCDVIIGASQAISEYNGTEKASHIRDKIVEMVHLSETLYACSIACSNEGYATESGAYIANPLLANVVKLNVTRNIYEVCRLCHDIAGGLLATLPSEADLRNLETSPFLQKYLMGRADVSAEDRMRMLRLIENLSGGTALVESMHGAGSPQAQRIMIYRGANLKQKVKLAEDLAGISKTVP